MSSWGLLASIGRCRGGLIDALMEGCMCGLSFMHPFSLANGLWLMADAYGNGNGRSDGMALHCILICSETRYPKRDLLELQDVLTGTDRDCVGDGEVGLRGDSPPHVATL